MKYILINNESDYGKITEFLPNFRVSLEEDTKGILFLGDNPQPYDSYSVQQLLREHNIIFSPIVKCQRCGNWTQDFMLINNNREGYYICNDCLEEYPQDYWYCEHCNDYFDDTVNSYTTVDGYTICQWCRDDYYFTCPGCNEIFHVDNGYYSDDDDTYYCPDCYDNNPRNLLYDYHEFRDWQPHHTEEENTTPPEFYIGHELEIDNGHNMSDAVDTISRVEGICMHDGSLSSNGIEFISHPFSYKYMLSQEENYRKTFNNLIDLGYKSHETSTCGLHFHVTRPNDPVIVDRIILFMETYKEEIFKISRRQSSELNRWSRFLSDTRRSVNEKVIKSLDYIVNNKETSDRYMALNLTNRKTIEFRFFKGTLNYDTFMADFEFVNNLVHYASDLSLPVEELTWTLVTSQGKFLPHYIEEHNLQSDKPIIDYSKELIVEFNEKKDKLRIKADTLLAEILKRISNKARTKNNTSQKLKETYTSISNLTMYLNDIRVVMYNLENGDMFNTDIDYLKSTLALVERKLGDK